jgi:hypothetical protein
MNRFGIAIAVGTALLAATPSAQAQIRGGTQPNNGTIYQTPRSSSQPIPRGQMPGAGMCRIWINGVPAGRQPAPTDCATAQRNVPANGRVIYGSQTQGPVYGNGQYDPRRDPRSSQYDPRLAPYNNGNGTNGTYGRNSDQNGKRQKERDKQWKKDHKGNNGNSDGDNHDEGNNGQRGQDSEHRSHDHQ